MLVTVREDAFEEGYVFKFCGGTYSEVLQGKPSVEVGQTKPIYMWYLSLVVKRLCCINCLNAEATTCATL